MLQEFKFVIPQNIEKNIFCRIEGIELNTLSEDKKNYPDADAVLMASIV